MIRTLHFHVNPIALMRIYAETQISKRIVDDACVEDRAMLAVLNKLKDDDIEKILVEWHEKTGRAIIDVPDMIHIEHSIERMCVDDTEYERILLNYANDVFDAFVYSRFDKRIMSHGVASHYEGILAAAESFFGVPEIYDYSKADIREWIVENIICSNAILSTVAYATQIANDIGR